MKRYYFDIRDGSQFIRDDEGVELPDIESARQEATAALSEITREWDRGRPQHRMAVAHAAPRSQMPPFSPVSFTLSSTNSRATGPDIESVMQNAATVLADVIVVAVIAYPAMTTHGCRSSFRD
ncbi:DUF6894 family protein [Bradyrhizobium sp. Pa8]|uniref:DUF6894 family protein n=1 Tax=Bradyrhizobium sp. Pa8 TaxID=3386552 RepID=UPI00403FA5CE